MSERLYKTLSVNGTQVRIARFHNIFGPYQSIIVAEKAPAAL